MRYWGYHLMLDSAYCNDNINHPGYVEQFLQALVTEIGMKPLGNPYVVYVDDEEGKGVSGVQLITTSTITFHGDADKNAVYLDVFSCKNFRPCLVTRLFDHYFRPASTRMSFVIRDATA